MGTFSLMQLYYWSGVSNFGDALNPWLWPRLLPDFFDDDPQELFIGIGSNLGYTFPQTAKKIVCGTGYGGTGYGGYADPPRINDMWDIRFVRGPRTAKALGLSPHLALGDPAMLVHQIRKVLPQANKRHAIGFMPHWESALYGAWQGVSTEAGAHFIDPRWSVERVISEIRGCDLLVTQAMHGAIVADALRVPWVPFEPLPMQRFKWFDWAESQGLDIQFRSAAGSTWLELAFCALEGHGPVWDLISAKGWRAGRIGSGLLRSRGCAAIRAAAASRPYLTSENALETTTDSMLVRLDKVRSRRAA
jgi:hypothetical protein